MKRLPRCSPDVALQYKQWTIPKNVSHLKLKILSKLLVNLTLHN